MLDERKKDKERVTYKYFVGRELKNRNEKEV